MEKVRPDILSFDHYPFMADSNADTTVLIMLDNLSDVRNVGMKYNVDTWDLSEHSWAGTRIPMMMNLDCMPSPPHIGLKSYSYFCTVSLPTSLESKEIRRKDTTAKDRHILQSSEAESGP